MHIFCNLFYFILYCLLFFFPFVVSSVIVIVVVVVVVMDVDVAGTATVLVNKFAVRQRDSSPETTLMGSSGGQF